MKYAYPCLVVMSAAAAAQNVASDAPLPGFINQATEPPPPTAVAGGRKPNVVNAVPKSPRMQEGVTYVDTPPEPPRIVEVAHPRAPAQSYIRREDYPPSAIAARQQGRVGMVLDIGADGFVTRCYVATPSGSAALDLASCRILRSRARFTPARDSHGNPAASMIRQEVEWRLP